MSKFTFDAWCLRISEIGVCVCVCFASMAIVSFWILAMMLFNFLFVNFQLSIGFSHFERQNNLNIGKLEKGYSFSSIEGRKT